MTRQLKVAVLAVVLVVVLTACSLQSPEQRDALMRVYRQMLESGQITQMQFDSLVAGLSGTTSWLHEIAAYGLPILGTLLGVQTVQVRKLKKAATALAP